MVGLDFSGVMNALEEGGRVYTESWLAIALNQEKIERANFVEKRESST